MQLYGYRIFLNTHNQLFSERFPSKTWCSYKSSNELHLTTWTAILETRRQHCRPLQATCMNVHRVEKRHANLAV
jgi:hypothetical protein